MVVDLARAEEALLHARKRKRSSKDGGSGGFKGRKQKTGADSEQAAPEAGEGGISPDSIGRGTRAEVGSAAGGRWQGVSGSGAANSRGKGAHRVLDVCQALD